MASKISACWRTWIDITEATNHQDLALTTSQVWTAGQVIGLIHDIPTCHDLVHRIEQEALDTLKKTQSLIVDKQPEPDIIGKPIGDLSANPKSEHGKAPGEAQIYDIGKAKL
jgi:hypothetical protein